MTTYTLSVSPDFSPDHLSGWFIFNTWLQRHLETGFHLELYDDFETQRADILQDKIDLIYANPYDASMLVRDKGFKAIARPFGMPDEAVIVTRKDSSLRAVENLQEGARVMATQDPDVNMMGMIMLEPADLDRSSIEMAHVHSYVLVAKALINGDADVGFFLKSAYEDLSDLVKQEMRILVQSEIHVVHHTLMAGPRIQHMLSTLLPDLLAMQEDEKGKAVLETMPFSAWEAMEEEDTEFMIDLIDTLID